MGALHTRVNCTNKVSSKITRFQKFCLVSVDESTRGQSYVSSVNLENSRSVGGGGYLELHGEKFLVKLTNHLLVQGQR